VLLTASRQAANTRRAVHDDPVVRQPLWPFEYLQKVWRQSSQPINAPVCADECEEREVGEDVELRTLDWRTGLLVPLDARDYSQPPERKRGS